MEVYVVALISWLYLLTAGDHFSLTKKVRVSSVGGKGL